jgi:hypothetical protein
VKQRFIIEIEGLTDQQVFDKEVAVLKKNKWELVSTDENGILTFTRPDYINPMTNKQAVRVVEPTKGTVDKPYMLHEGNDKYIPLVSFFEDINYKVLLITNDDITASDEWPPTPIQVIDGYEAYEAEV